ncbi:hypothetical protein HU200_017873 [Digitaria exilis]|uniref:Transcription repressor n=1 Tax=Digitaria exilis TaxID=1010633 RepID=A0A835F4X4_9POAL|nr:hypothetical protein HU200_017873 [Digitaria exilis]
MPAPKWFQKLRRRKNKAMQMQVQQGPCRTQAAAAVDAGAAAAAAATTSAASADNCHTGSQRRSSSSSLPAMAWAVSPNRASYYFATADRARQDRDLPCAADVVALDVRVDVVHRRAGEERRRLGGGGLDAPPGTPELKLRPIVTRPTILDASESASASATTSAATTPSTRARGFHVSGRRRHRRRQRRDHDGGASVNKKGKAAAEEEVEAGALLQQHGGAMRRRRRWLYESLVVVKASSDPEREMAESMAEMVVANGIRSSEDLEELLACYLALNAAEHHRAVVAAFRHVWSLLARHSLLLR